MSDQIKAFSMVLDSMKRKREGTPAPIAMCPSCNEPLIMTFQFPGKEFICVCCRKLWEFIDPTPAEATPERIARHQVLKAKWEAEQKEPTKWPYHPYP